MFLLKASDISSPPQRIISLVPSQTELLHYLELEKETIAITKFCVHPNEWFRNKTRIGGTKDLNIEKIISLQPDLIIANKEENVKDQIDSLAEFFPVWLTDVNTFDEALKMISDLGSLTHTSDKAHQLIESITRNFLSLPANRKVPAAYLIWKDPYMAAGGDTFISDMMNKAGFNNVFADLKRYPNVTLQDIVNSRCEIILLSSEPFPFKEQHAEDFRNAVKNVKVVLTDGEMFSWYGSRMLEAPGYIERLYNEIRIQTV